MPSDALPLISAFSSDAQRAATSLGSTMIGPRPSETTRERETFRYGPTLLANSSDPSSALKTSSDPILTSFCQLAASRLQCARSLISLFDRDHQHVVAEATSTSSLMPNADARSDDEKLWLCGLALPRSYGVCEHVLDKRQGMTLDDVTVFDDLLTHNHFATQAACGKWPGNRFYAGIPLRTPKKINIGVLCVFDDKPRDGLDTASKLVMQELAAVIMSYLEGRRNTDKYRQADRVTRGIRNFFDRRPEQNTSKDILPIELEGDASDESNRSTKNHHVYPASMDPTYRGSSSPLPSPIIPSVPEQGQDKAHRVLNRAAQIFRGALEVDGLVLLDASLSFANHRVAGVGDEDDNIIRDGNEESTADRDCTILTSSVSPMNQSGGESYFDQAVLRERTLRNLLRHYPRGTVWNYDEDGLMDSSDVSGDETASNTSNEAFARPTASETSRSSGDRCAVRRNLRREVLQLLPRARSVAFFPMWDSQKQRWFAGGFAYSTQANRVLSVRSELSYLRAFSAVTMAELSSIRDHDVQSSKLGVLNSISHELRSPLHGIILGTELLQEQPLHILQQDALNSIEVCSRTLLDTIDQILDWSKVNRFASSQADDPNYINTTANSRASRSSRTNQADAGMMSITSDVDLVSVIEDVLESVHAGHAFQRRSFPLASDTLGAEQDEQDGVKLMVQFASNFPWSFHVQVGAIRRIVMNVLGNALKYTKEGFIYIGVEQSETAGDPAKGKIRKVQLTIADTGCGISKDYLAHDVFKPFSQEDHLGSGAGLGLSVVKRIVESLHGTLKIQSSADVGTTVVISLPLEVCEQELEPTVTVLDKPRLKEPDAILASPTDLRNLRIALLGYSKDSHAEYFKLLKADPWSEEQNVATVCQEWLGMQVVEDPLTNTVSPDIALCNAARFEEALLFTRQRMIPLVVICQDAVVARRLAAKYSADKTNEHWAHFTHQPTGPRTLAKTLSRTLENWIARQAASGHQLLRDDSITPPLQDGDRTFAAEQVNSLDAPETSLPTRPRLSTPLERANPFELKEERTKTTFLLVDDNPINLKMLVIFMKKLKCQYVTAADGEQAVARYRENPLMYKCIFMDISMPVMNGFDATRAIRAQENEQALPRCTILALTGLASQESQKEAFLCGIDLFLTKPVKLAEIQQILKARQLLDCI